MPGRSYRSVWGNRVGRSVVQTSLRTPASFLGVWNKGLHESIIKLSALLERSLDKDLSRSCAKYETERLCSAKVCREGMTHLNQVRTTCKQADTWQNNLSMHSLTWVTITISAVHHTSTLSNRYLLPSISIKQLATGLPTGSCLALSRVKASCTESGPYLR